MYQSSRQHAQQGWVPQATPEQERPSEFQDQFNKIAESELVFLRASALAVLPTNKYAPPSLNSDYSRQEDYWEYILESQGQATGIRNRTPGCGDIRRAATGMGTASRRRRRLWFTTAAPIAAIPGSLLRPKSTSAPYKSTRCTGL